MMTPFALNHVTAQHLSIPDLFTLAASLKMDAVELRNDLTGAASIWAYEPQQVRAMSSRTGVAVLTVAQLNSFDRWDEERSTQARKLADWASAAGASALMLSPTLDGSLRTHESRTTALRQALVALRPILDDRKLIGSIEPVGRDSASVQSHTDVIRALDGLFARPHPFRIAYDTFQWRTATDQSIAPELISVIQASGVDPGTPLVDSSRVLPSAADLTGARAQIGALRHAGVNAPVSFECLSPVLADDEHLYDNLRAAMQFVSTAPLSLPHANRAVE
jgi:2-keto-myo-inositol isomerase